MSEVAMDKDIRGSDISKELIHFDEIFEYIWDMEGRTLEGG